MAIELITGRAGVPHVDSFDVGAFNATMFGGGAYVLEGVTATLVDANNVNVNAGELLCEGRHIRITGAGEDLVIENGLSAYKRHDVIAIKYLRDEDGIETTELVVIKGESVIDNPVDPAMPTSGKLIEGASEVYWPLYRIVIDGLTPQTPVFIARRQAVYTLGLGTEIPSGADLNDYTTPGVYYIPGSIVPTLVNCPVTAGVTTQLVVYMFSDTIVGQEYILSTYNGNSGKVHQRRGSATGFDPWICVSGIDSIVAYNHPTDFTYPNFRWTKYASGRVELETYVTYTSQGWLTDSGSGDPYRKYRWISHPFSVKNPMVFGQVANWVGQRAYPEALEASGFNAVVTSKQNAYNPIGYFKIIGYWK